MCLASTVIEKLEKFSKAVIRFLEGKTKLVIGEIKMEFIVDGQGHVWLIGCKSIQFYNAHKELDTGIIKEELHFPKYVFKQHLYCPGAYCKFIGENGFTEEGDEALEIFVKLFMIF